MLGGSSLQTKAFIMKGTIMVALIIILILMFLILGTIALNIKIVPQAHKWVIERLGVYHTTWEAGLHVKMPFIDRIVNKVSTKEQVYDFPPQPVITSDNVTMQIDTVVYAVVTDAKLYTYGTENPTSATETLAATTLRNIVGSMELDTTLVSRDTINDKMRTLLDEATDPWGIRVLRVEIKNIKPPKDIQDAMEQQMKAERTKRAKILDAEGDKQSAILRAQGHKEAKILDAEGEKEAQILTAEAEKQRKIKEAEGEAESILKTQSAFAQSIERLNKAKPTKEVLMLKAYNTMTDMADGQATKIILPTELANLGGFVAAIKEGSNFNNINSLASASTQTNKQSKKQQAQ